MKRTMRESDEDILWERIIVRHVRRDKGDEGDEQSVGICEEWRALLLFQLVDG